MPWEWYIASVFVYMYMYMYLFIGLARMHEDMLFYGGCVTHREYSGFKVFQVNLVSSMN